MKRLPIVLTMLILAAFTFQSCEDMDDNAVPAQEFVWKGLNQYYLWQPNVPDLADDRFQSTAQFDNFLSAYGSPENVFEHLLYERGTVDRWSVIFSDFFVLENALQGVVKSNGVEFGLKYVPGSTTQIFGYVRYIQPNSDASTKDIHRGDLFYAINGTPLTTSNYNSPLDLDTYTLNLPDYAGGVFDLVTRGSRLAAQHVQDDSSLFTISNVGGWFEPIYFHGGKKTTGTAAYSDHGFVLSGGLERKSALLELEGVR